MLKRQIRIGYIGESTPMDRHLQSGIPFMMCRAFERMGAEVVWIPARRSLRYKLGRGLSLLSSLIKGKRELYALSRYGSKELARGVDNNLLKGVDLYLNINNSAIFANLDLDKPVIYRSDATFKLMIDYYLSNLSQKAIRESNEIEQRALNQGRVVLYPSRWARNSAVRDYNQPKEKLHVVESGANIDSGDIQIQRKRYDGGVLRLLFLGVDWIRKGGDVALGACEYLRQKGVNVRLYIVGIRDLSDHVSQLPYVDNIGFLSKNNPVEYKRLVEIIKSSHALLLPTLAECAGIVFCESSGYGLPSFTYDTGGVGEYVINGVNGYRLPLGSTGDDFGEKIYKSIHSAELEQLSAGAVELYHKRLNWSVWQDRVEKIINDII